MYKLKNKLSVYIVAFGIFAFALFLVFNKFYVERKNRVNTVGNKLFTIENSIIHCFNDISTVLLKSLNDTSIVFTEQNILILQLRKNLPRLNQEIESLNTEYKYLPEKSVSDINKIVEYYHSYIAYMDKITEILRSKAEANKGILSKLNHIESKLFSTPFCNKESTTQLKLYSRYYLLYKNQEYLDNINWITKSIESDLKRKNIPDEDKVRFSAMLSNYNVLFRKLEQIDMMLDFKSPMSYTYKMVAEKDKILAQFDKTYLNITNYQRGLVKSGIIFYSILFALLMVSALLFSNYMTRLVVKPILWLTDNIVKIIYDKHEKEDIQSVVKTFKEVDDLFKKILVLLQYLKDQEDKRQAAQKELKQSEHRYRELADMLPQSIYETDSLGNFVYVNRAWFKTFGFEHNEVERGMNVIETIVSETGEALMGNRRFVHSDFIGIRKDGTTFPAIVYSNKIIRNGKMTGIRGIVIDNTERTKYIDLLKKEKERAENLDKQKTSYLADMSHELRTPMNAILGFADLLASLELSNKQKEEFVNHINQSSKHVLHLIDDIIDLARIEAGELKINRINTDIHALMHNLFITYEEILKQSGKDRKIELVLNIPSSELNIETDSHRLNQVINNLLSNALKFTEQGRIEFGYHYTESKLIRFYVKDTGIGIDEENIHIIFNRFQQTINDYNQKGKGLGLSISKKIVGLLGGKIWVESEPGNTSFYFTLPVIKTNKPVPGIELETDDIYNWKDKLILIAEDEDMNYKIIKEYISKTGAKVIRAYDGEEAVELCMTNHKIDLVLMDIKMPKKDGYKATMEIKELRENLPVVAVTAYALSKEKENCFKAGCDGYIAKPFRKEFFLKTLNPYLIEPVDISE